MSIVETFHGYIETTQDTLLIFEACRRGLFPRICRRLQEKERRIVQSGTVFVFDERESGIKRWTDGLVWSPSRILGNFLVYRELDKRNSGKKDASPIDRASRCSSSDPETAIEKNKERALVGSLTNSYRFKKNGLIKKTMSIVVNGVPQHLISYYSKDDVLAGRLRTPSSVPELASLDISPEFLMKQNFRIPPNVEQSYDHLADHMHSPTSNHSPRTPNGAFAHAMNGAAPDFGPSGYGVRPKLENDLSSLDVFSKPYHPAQSHHPLHTPQGGYHTMAHLGAGAQHHHQQQHQNASHNPYYANNFPYVSVPSAAGGDNTSGTPPPLRYLPRSQSFMPYPSAQSTHHQQQPQQTQQHSVHHQQQPQPQQQQQQQQQQRHNNLPYGTGSAALMMSNSNGTALPNVNSSNGNSSTNGNSNGSNDFGFSMGYHSPTPTQPSTFGGGFPNHSSSPQISHSSQATTSHQNSHHQQPQQQPQQHYSHTAMPPSTQPWNDLGGYAPYPNTSMGSLGDHSSGGQHVEHSVSP
ncbi:Gti1/Pac2 family transcription factor [Entomortierella parvispora]|uniref:Gti1/Pac2 family transcription factor n=1 Tax=Entomortierella parvispora TaxID=205924 RepID=A0A9P3HDA2_9FUNG|nr:Gti1/Pac2 family transcription factor [Entomortierella parvispora]